MNNENLQPTYFLDFDHPLVAKYAMDHTQGAATPQAKAVALFYRIRDEFAYSPYGIDLRPAALKASALIGKKSGYCEQKAALMAACCRAVGIEARLQFFNVRNHVGIGALKKYTKIDLLVFHTGLQVKLDGQWLKVLPAFDQALCAKLGIPPVEFDGRSDASTQVFEDQIDGKTAVMEYVHDYGAFADLPLEFVMGELVKYYPHIFDPKTPKEELKFISHWDPAYLPKTR